MDNKKLKILSIDGGGIRGIIPARVLCELEEQIVACDGPDAKLCDYFDLVCGTSTGGIIAAGIALGLPAKEILTLYTEHAGEIFPSKHDKVKAFDVLFNRPFYKRDALEKILKDTYGRCARDKDTRVYHCRTRLCIPVYDASKDVIHIFKTDHLPNYHRDCHIPITDVVLASAAAPAYFYPHTFDYMTMGTDTVNSYTNNIDGGLFANNPTLIGLTEARCCMGVPLEDIAILSLGTGKSSFKANEGAKSMGSGYWISPLSGTLKLYEAMSSAQSIYIDNTMKLIKDGAGADKKGSSDISSDAAVV